MSVEAMAIALHHSQTTQATQRLVLLGIANHEGDGGAFPSVNTLAHYAAVDDRTVQRAIKELVTLQEIRVEYQGGNVPGLRPERQPNRYFFQLKCPRNCDRSSRHQLVCVDCEAVLGRKLGRRALRCKECQAALAKPVDNTGDTVPPGDKRVTQTTHLLNPLEKSPSVSNAGARVGDRLPCHHVSVHVDAESRRAWCGLGCPATVIA